MTGPALSPKQMWSIHQSTLYKLALWVGAVSGGKTIASLFALLIAIRNSRGSGLIVIVGKTLQTIERNVLEPLQDVALFGETSKLVEHTRGSNMARILGREVHLVGANDIRSEEKIRGSTIEIAYVDEATLLPHGFWEMLLTRLRVRGARLLATTNPGSSQHWLRVKYILDHEAQNLVVFHFTMHDNPLYFEGGDPGPAYIADMEAAFRKSPLFFDRMIRGLWTNAEGAVFDLWNTNDHVIAWEQLPPMRRLIGVGIDYGTTHPTAALMLGLGYDRRLYFVDELRITAGETVAGVAAGARFTDAQQSKIIRAWLAAHDHLPADNANWLRPEYIVADPAGASLREQLDQDGVDTYAADKDVDYGIRLMASLLGQGKLLVAAASLDGKHGCPGLIREFPDYVWDVKKQAGGVDEPDKARGHDDSLDAGRYTLVTLEAQWRDDVLTASPSL